MNCIVSANLCSQIHRDSVDIADGGSIWTNGNVSGKKLPSVYGDLAKEDYVGHFAYLEGQVFNSVA